MRTRLLIAVTACALAGAAAAMTKDEYQTQRLRIQHQYATAKDRCSAVTGHARDLCRTQAHAQYDIARAELRAQYKPGPRNRQKAEKAKADAGYQVAREQCGDLQGNARDVCREEAKARWQSARAEAKADLKAQDQGLYSPQAFGERQRARETQSEHAFAAARERCDSLSGSAREICLSDAKKKFAKP